MRRKRKRTPAPRRPVLRFERAAWVLLLALTLILSGRPVPVLASTVPSDLVMVGAILGGADVTPSRPAAWDDVAVINAPLTLLPAGGPTGLVPPALADSAAQGTVSLHSRAPPSLVRSLATLR